MLQSAAGKELISETHSNKVGNLADEGHVLIAQLPSIGTEIVEAAEILQFLQGRRLEPGTVVRRMSDLQNDDLRSKLSKFGGGNRRLRQHERGQFGKGHDPRNAIVGQLRRI